MAVFLREDGPTTEVLDPYPSIGTSMRERGVRIPRKIVLVSARSSVSSAAQLQADNEVIKRALVQYGPLSTSYYHGSSYLKGAAYYCKYRYGSNHAVSIVGWDDDYAASNFKTTLGFEPQVAYMRLSKGRGGASRPTRGRAESTGRPSRSSTKRHGRTSTRYEAPLDSASELGS